MVDEQTLRIRGKGNRERIIYLNEATKEAITEYMKIRPNLQKDNKDYDALFISKQYKRISRRYVQGIIENELYSTFNDKEAGLHTHSLRHTSATLMYNENNTDIFIINKILGHKSLSATELYTHVSDQKMKEIMQTCTISSILARKENEK